MGNALHQEMVHGERSASGDGAWGTLCIRRWCMGNALHQEMVHGERSASGDGEKNIINLKTNIIVIFGKNK